MKEYVWSCGRKEVKEGTYFVGVEGQQLLKEGTQTRNIFAGTRFQLRQGKNSREAMLAGTYLLLPREGTCLQLLGEGT